MPVSFESAPKIDAQRGSPPSDQIDASYEAYLTFGAQVYPEILKQLQPGDKAKLNNYGRGKVLTQRLNASLADLGVGTRENEDVLLYQDTVALVDGFVDSAVLNFKKEKRARHTQEGTLNEEALAADKSSVVVIVEDPCYDRVAKDLSDRVAAGDVKVIRCPFDAKTSEVKLSSLDGVLEKHDMPIFYRTPVNNPTGINTRGQDQVIYESFHAAGGYVITDYAYHFLDDRNSVENPLQAFSDATEYSDLCLGQFSKVTGQNTLSVGVWKTDRLYLKSFVDRYYNGHFTDPDQQKVAFLHHLLSTEQGRAMLYEFEQKGVEMVKEVRALFAASSLKTLIKPNNNDGYFELIEVAEDEETARDVLAKANIDAGIVGIDGRFGARVSYSLPLDTISQVISRLEAVLELMPGGDS